MEELHGQLLVLLVDGETLNTSQIIVMLFMRLNNQAEGAMSIELLMVVLTGILLIMGFHQLENTDL